MNGLAMLGGLKKYLPTIIYSILGLVILFMLYKLIIRLKSGGDTLGGIVADKAENSTISHTTGVPIGKIKLIRNDAFSLAHDLNTFKGFGFLDKAKNFHIQFDSDTLKRFKNVSSEPEMSVFKNIYENEYTNNNSLLDDLKGTLSSANLAKVPFIISLY